MKMIGNLDVKNLESEVGPAILVVRGTRERPGEPWVRMRQTIKVYGKSTSLVSPDRLHNIIVL